MVMLSIFLFLVLLTCSSTDDNNSSVVPITTTTTTTYIITGNLPNEAIKAINMTPCWLKADLNNMFIELTNSETQSKIANAIISATKTDYIDELAFIFAHTRISILNDQYFYPELYLENVEKIYTYSDPQNVNKFKYVERVEYGDSKSGCDFYTTLKYHVIDGSTGQDRWFEIDKNIYYWYVVHPVMEDEKPYYINPNNGSNIYYPPEAFFWRTYLYDVQDPICPYSDGTTSDDGLCPILIDRMKDVQYAWNYVKNDTSSTHAIGSMNQFINDVMYFGAGSERPIQPVRIYKIHKGNCGEWADITTAVSRTCLIPAVNAVANLHDHTWNEFWMEGWHQWEPVNYAINSPVYWWDTHGAYITKGDGITVDVTDHYTNTFCNINIIVHDNNAQPINEAKITLAGYWDGTTDIYGFFQGYTDENGNFSTKVGLTSTVSSETTNDFFAKVETSLGNYPSSGVTKIVDDGINGRTYNWHVVIGTSTKSEEKTYPYAGWKKTEN